MPLLLARSPRPESRRFASHSSGSAEPRHSVCIGGGEEHKRRRERRREEEKVKEQRLVGLRRCEGERQVGKRGKREKEEGEGKLAEKKEEEKEKRRRRRRIAFWR